MLSDLISFVLCKSINITVYVSLCSKVDLGFQMFATTVIDKPTPFLPSPSRPQKGERELLGHIVASYMQPCSFPPPPPPKFLFRMKPCMCSVMCQLPIELNYRKSRANYRHIVYVWSTDKFTERGRAISGRSIEAYPPVFDFARFLNSEALLKAIYHSLGCK